MKKALLRLAAAASAIMIISSSSPVRVSMLEPVQEIRIISQNLQCERRNNFDVRGPEMVKRLLSYDPDSIGAQENGAISSSYADWPETFENFAPGYSRVGGTCDHDVTANYIYYNSEKFELVDSETFWLNPNTLRRWSEWGTYSCSLTWARLRDRSTGFEYVHVNTHLSYKYSEENYVQAGIVASLVGKFIEAGIPVFVTGDFNTSEGSASYSLMTSLPSVSDSKYLAEKSMSGGTYRGWGWRDLSGSKPIDFCFVSDRNVMVREYEIIDTYVDENLQLSDHNGLFVRAEASCDGIYDDSHKPSTDGMEITEISRRSYVYEFGFPQGNDFERIHDYVAVLYDANGKPVDRRIMQSYNVGDQAPDMIRVEFGCLEPGTEYTVVLFARSILGIESDRISFTFRTRK